MTETSTTGDGWTPAFPGQRPPWLPGNTAALVHGARSGTRVGALATQIGEELLASPDCPAHLREPLFGPAIDAWARAEAVVRLLWAYLEDKTDNDITAALTESSASVETEQADRKAGKTTRRTAGRRVASVLSELHRAETRAASARSVLGLDPQSAARIGRDLAARRYMDGATPLDAAVAAIARQRAIEAGDTPADRDDDDNGS